MAKKVLIIRFTPYDSDLTGYNIQEVGLGKAFCRMGYDYTHICFKKKDQKRWTFYEHNGCRAEFWEMPRKRFFRMGINLDICKREFLQQYDIVICREYNQIMTYLCSKNSNNVSMYSGPYWNMFMLKITSPIYDALFTRQMNKNLRGKFVKSVLAKAYLEKKGFTGLVSVGVGLDMERFCEVSEMDDNTKGVVDFMKEHRCILFIGRLNKNKNFPLLIETYRQVQQKYPDVKFVMIGAPEQTSFGKLMRKTDESYVQDILSQYPDKVRNGIYRVNRVPNQQLKYIYPLAKAFLLPSRREIFGMVMLEAMYLGAPVITSRNGGSLTLIGDDGPGTMISDYIAEKWSAAVINYLDSPEKVKAMTMRAHQLVAEHYNWDTIARKMLSHITINQ